MMLGVRRSCALFTLLVSLCAWLLSPAGAIAQEAGQLTVKQTTGGHWTATLLAGEHQIAFEIEIPERAGSLARISTGFPGTATARFEGNTDEMALIFPRHESRIVAARVGENLYGEWRRERIVDGLVTVERIPFEARRAMEGGGCAVLSEVAPLPTRWVSEPDECGSSAKYTINTGDFGDVIMRSVGPDGRIVTYPGSWSPTDGTLSLTRFDGVEAQVIHAMRRPDGSFEGRIWTGSNMPERWAIRPVQPAPEADPPTSAAPDAISASGRLRLIP
jgi:hypothetical protein